MRTVVHPDPETLAQAFAAQFLTWAHESLERFGRFRIAISGGRGVKHLFEALSQHGQELDWSRVEVYWVDERWVPWTDPESNSGEAERLWLDQLPKKPKIYPMWAKETTPQAGALAYEALLAQRFKPGLPFFDLCILGVGPDGHTASLFPGAAPMKEEKRAVIAVQHPESGQWRTTLTLPAINSSLRCVVLLDGKEKAAALKGVLAGDPALPLSHVRPIYTQLVFFVDQSAARDLN